MAHVGAAERGVRDAAHRDNLPSRCELIGEDAALFHLAARRRTVRRFGSGMCRDDVPEEHVVLDAELGEDAVDDRGRRLGRAGAGEEPLRRERDPRDAGAPVARRLADQEDPRRRARVEIGREPVAALGSARRRTGRSWWSARSGQRRDGR